MKKITTCCVAFLVGIINTLAQTPVSTFQVAALNVDGLPKKIATVEINPDAQEEAGATAIGQKLATMGYDVIGVSEDFNFNDYLVAPLEGIYHTGTWRGSIAPNAGQIISLAWQGYHADTDGLNLFWKNGVSAANETWEQWNDWNGYTDNGADGLIKKGFRYYNVTLAPNVVVDVYILHMDAEVSDGDIAAREKQMAQLVNAIKSKKTIRPIIVMGDTNCRYTRDKLKELLINELNADLRYSAHDAWVEHNLSGVFPAYNSAALMVDQLGYEKGEIVDKIIYINNSNANLQLKLKSFKVDTSFIAEDGTPLADHFPVVAEFEVYNAQDFEDVPTYESNTFYLRNIATGKFLKAGGWWGSHAVVGEYGMPITFTQLPSGKYDIQTIYGYIGNDAYMDVPIGEDRAVKEWNVIEKNGLYVLSFDDHGSQKALSSNDPFFFPSSPNYRYVTVEDLNTSSACQQWEMLTSRQLLEEMMQATSSSPYNATHLVSGANFDRNDNGRSAWRFTRTDNNQVKDMKMEGVDSHELGNQVCYVHTDKPWTGANNNWTVSQTVSGLPNGRYKVTFQGFYKEGSNTTEHKVKVTLNNQELRMKNVYEEGLASSLYADGEELVNNKYYPTNSAGAGLYFSHGAYVHEVEDVMVTDGTLYICVEKDDNIKSSTTDTYFDNFQIYFEQSAVTIPFAIKAENQWATLILPFEAEIPAGLEVKTIESVQEDGTLTLTNVDKIEATTPYIVYAGDGIDTGFTGCLPEMLETTYSDAHGLTGVLADEGAVPAAGSYVLQNQNGQVGFYQVGNNWDGHVAPYHCYVHADNQGVKTLFLNGTATFIDHVTLDNDEQSRCYDLQGRRVQNAHKGIYIINGKKVLF